MHSFHVAVRNFQLTCHVRLLGEEKITPSSDDFKAGTKSYGYNIGLVTVTTLWKLVFEGYPDSFAKSRKANYNHA